MLDGALTLVVVELLGVVAIQLAENLGHVRVGIGAAEGIARAIKTEDQLLVFSGHAGWGAIHGRRDGFSVRHAAAVGGKNCGDRDRRNAETSVLGLLLELDGIKQSWNMD